MAPVLMVMMLLAQASGILAPLITNKCFNRMFSDYSPGPRDAVCPSQAYCLSLVVIDEKYYSANQSPGMQIPATVSWLVIIHTFWKHYLAGGHWMQSETK